MATYQIFGATSGPGAQASDATNYTLGVEFYSSATGCTVTQVRFWASATVTSSNHACRIYQVGNGTPLTGSSKAFPSPLQAGWNTVTLDSPVAITQNTRYLACVYFTTDDGYTATADYWTSGAGSSGITNSPLVAPNNAGATGPGQGCFKVDGDIIPDGSFNGGNYWVDVTINDGASGSVSGTVAAPLGALTAHVTGTHTAVGSISAPLGALTAAVTGTHSAVGSVTCSLGGLSATVTGVHTAVGSVAAPLGALIAHVTGTRSTAGSVACPLGGLSASVVSASARTGTIACSLGVLTARLTQYVEPAAVVETGSWGPLLALVREARTTPRTDPREAAHCPNDGSLLLPDPRGGLRCPFDGYHRR